MGCKRRRPCPEPPGHSGAQCVPAQKGYGLTELENYQKKQIFFGTIFLRGKNISGGTEKTHLRIREAPETAKATLLWREGTHGPHRHGDALRPRSGAGLTRPPCIHPMRQKGLPQYGAIPQTALKSQEDLRLAYIMRGVQGDKGLPRTARDRTQNKEPSIPRPLREKTGKPPHKTGHHDGTPQTESPMSRPMRPPRLRPQRLLFRKRRLQRNGRHLLMRPGE